MAATGSAELLLSLPREVLLHNILPLASIPDIQSFDAALSLSRLRTQLLNLLKSYEYSSPKSNIFDLTELQWLLDRGVTFVELEVVVDHASVLEFVVRIPTLKKLVIQYSCRGLVLTNNFLLQLAQACPLLEVLQLADGLYTDSGVIALAQHCNQLKSIQMFCEHLSDAAIYALCEHCPQLQSISLSKCINLTAASLYIIAVTHPNVTVLRIGDCEFNDDTLSCVAQTCQQLRSLHLIGLSSDSIPKIWQSNANLIEVDLSVSLCADQDIILLSQSCPLLQNVNVSMCLNITDIGISFLAERCKHLQTLDVFDCQNLSNASLFAIGQHCHELKSINISYCDRITDAGVAKLAAGCSSLQEFSAMKCSFTSTGVAALAKGCPSLRLLDISHCIYVGVHGICRVAENCRLVSCLLMCECNVDDECLRVIAENCQNLTLLNISNCGNVSPAGVRAVVKSCRELRRCLTMGCRLLESESLISLSDYSSGPPSLDETTREQRVVV